MNAYIHYGNASFDKNKFETPRNIKWNNKPYGGLWASRVDAKYGWREWCKENDFIHFDHKKSFTFTLSDNANIMHINCVADVKKLPEQDFDREFTCIKTVDFEKLMANGIDAIEFNISNDWDLYMALYGWDCDSTLILNPDIITIQN